MPDDFLPAPRVVPPLDPDFRPPALARAEFRRRVAEARRSEALVFALERDQDQVSHFRTQVFADSEPESRHNADYAERLLKTLLWQRGARRVLVVGPHSAIRALPDTYSSRGARAFDAGFFTRVYERAFSVELAELTELPKQSESVRRLGGDFSGCRIGFDAGGSDCKVSALIDGRPLYAAEFPWLPKEQADPAYHLSMVHDCIEKARAHLPRLDAIGVSSAGIYVNDQTRVASLFRRVAPELFEAHIKNIYVDLGQRFGAAVAVANDGDVAALAGALELGHGALLGLAFGTSLAGGFVDGERRIAGWLNELAFAPHDLSATAPVDLEWSGDRGTGVHYLSQDAALRLAPRAGLGLRPATLAEQLRELQALADDHDARALSVFESLGVYLGYALLDYAEFYPMRHVLLLGRVSSGAGGARLLRAARRVLELEAPALHGALALHLPNESQRRVGQALTAASLPILKQPEAP
ncbi:MAG: hypothetical protein QM756_22445 [Polyangiaceae bacterium]